MFSVMHLEMFNYIFNFIYYKFSILFFNLVLGFLLCYVVNFELAIIFKTFSEKLNQVSEDHRCGVFCMFLL